MLSVSYLPVVRSVLGRPAPLRLATVLRNRVTGGLWVCTGRLDITTSRLHVATGRLDVTPSRGWLRTVVAAGASRERRVRIVVRTGRLSGWCAGCSVCDHNGGSLAVSKSNGGSLSGVGT